MSYFIVMHNLSTGKLPVSINGGFSRQQPYAAPDYKTAFTTASAMCEKHKSAFCIENAAGKILRTLYPKNRAEATIPPVIKASKKSGIRKATKVRGE